jgi:ketosteroid isomerase-like protein
MTKGSNYEVASVTGSGIRRAVAPTAALGVLPTLYAPYVGTMKFSFRRSLNRLSVGDVEPFLGIYAEDVRPVLSGRHSWAGDHRGKGEVRRWIRRFVRIGIRLEPHEILVTGPPWITIACPRFTDRLVAQDGEVVYANRPSSPSEDVEAARIGRCREVLSEGQQLSS